MREHRRKAGGRRRPPAPRSTRRSVNPATVRTARKAERPAGRRTGHDCQSQAGEDDRQLLALCHHRVGLCAACYALPGISAAHER